MPTTLPARKTPLTKEQAAKAMRVAYRRVFGEDPRPEVLALVLAKAALETGNFQSIWLGNFGNIKAADSYGGFVQFYRCNEIINGKVQWFDPPHPQTRFRAYASASDGAEDYFRFIAGRKRYALAHAAMLRGDPVEYVRELKRAGYFTAHEEPYRKAVVSLVNTYRPYADRELLEAVVPDPEPDESEEHSAFSDDDFQTIWMDPDWQSIRADRDAAVTGNDPGDDVA